MEFEKQFLPHSVHRALELDGPDVLPLTSPYEVVNTPSDILSQFNDVSMEKGKHLTYH